MPPSQSPFEAAETATLRAPSDAANCGDFSFSLYVRQLIVSMLGSGGTVGGEYDLATLPLHQWTHLIDRTGNPLPIHAMRDHTTVTLQVGNVTTRAACVARPTR
jgi:hypothetical protein